MKVESSFKVFLYIGKEYKIGHEFNQATSCLACYYCDYCVNVALQLHSFELTLKKTIFFQSALKLNDNFSTFSIKFI